MTQIATLAPAASALLDKHSLIPSTAEHDRALNRVEYYQPFYGISGFENPLCSCLDRANAIADEIGPAAADCRLVDFGSSLGYFPFCFADRGAIANGIDLSPGNTALALATQRLNGLQANFQTAALNLPLVRGIAAGEIAGTFSEPSFQFHEAHVRRYPIGAAVRFTAKAIQFKGESPQGRKERKADLYCLRDLRVFAVDDLHQGGANRAKVGTA